MVRSLNSGVSAMKSLQEEMDVIGNNIANSGTVGFKQSQAQFADVYAASLSGSGATQIGLGTRTAAIAHE